jgi:dihydroorotate dehydrogenase electron transfer subunit
MIKDKRYTLPIAEIREESGDVRTFSFDVSLPVLPGQFIMLTDFKGSEKPFSISDYKPAGSAEGKSGRLSVTVKRIGDFTSRLFEKKAGELMSIRGAYGSSFFIPGPSNPDEQPAPEPFSSIKQVDFYPVLCGGGFGLPPLYLLAERLLSAGVPAENIRVIGAARKEADLLFENRFIELGLAYTGAAETLADAQPGCGRICGTAADALSVMTAEAGESPPEKNSNTANFLYASGPDLMMKSLVPCLPPNAEYQFLFERYMKCAIGICGSCVTDPGGLRICKEGPALWRSQVEMLRDFGVYRRAASGCMEYFTNRLEAQETKAKAGTVR